MKGFSKALVAAGQLLSTDDIVSSVLGRLGLEYNPVVVTNTARQSYISLQEVQYLFISYESKLAQHNTATTLDLAHASANYSSNTKGGFRGAPNQGPRGRSRGIGRGRYGGRGGPSFFYQLCGKSGHVVTTCYHRFEHNFQ
ncbi:hypothetical protein ACOSP7_026874 [Xanthoceras sorbifolium]